MLAARMRVRAALLLTSSGEDWVRAFGAYNSGTYNNQVRMVCESGVRPSVGGGEV